MQICHSSTPWVMASTMKTKTKTMKIIMYKELMKDTNSMIYCQFWVIWKTVKIVVHMYLLSLKYLHSIEISVLRKLRKMMVKAWFKLNKLVIELKILRKINYKEESRNY